MQACYCLSSDPSQSSLCSKEHHKGLAVSRAPGLQPSQPKRTMGSRKEAGSQGAPLFPAIFVPWRKSLAESLPVDGVVAHTRNPSTQEVEYEANLGYTAIPCLRKQIMGWRDGPRSRVLAAFQEHLSLALSTYGRKFMAVYNSSSRIPCRM